MYYTLHLHCYQPPRENPWTDKIEKEPSAAPYDNWNERIAEECYNANLGNFAQVSFNFGPTLLRWLKKEKSNIYQGILKADKESCARFNGHGNALAHPYHHVILPLASPRVRELEIHWGIEDFKSRFNRKPEGFWLPETAVNTPVLEALAGQGIRFVILSPHQARRVRQPDEDWQDVSNGNIDTTKPYQCALASGKRLAVFFYEAVYAHEIAFGQALATGDNLFKGLSYRITNLKERRLFHIATDGETFGHHHREGAESLSMALSKLKKLKIGQPANYGFYLKRCPPSDTAQIKELSSWSCFHGVERWRSDCGCKISGGSQAWRAALRDALVWLSGRLDGLFDEESPKYLRDPGAALKDAFVLWNTDHHNPGKNNFWQKHRLNSLTAKEFKKAADLMEIMRHKHAMFTSCGWFFDDIGGLEAKIVLRHAARAAKLAALFGTDLTNELKAWLESGQSNYPDPGNASKIFGEMLAGK